MKVISDGNVLEIASGGGTYQEVYSTEEQTIGTWIDGKPLYRAATSISYDADIYDELANGDDTPTLDV